MKIKKLKVLVLLPTVFLMTSSQKTDPDYFEISKNLKLVASVYEKINNYYVDDILPGRVMKKGIDAMLKSLDPYTIYISELRLKFFYPLPYLAIFIINKYDLIPFIDTNDF